MDIRRYFGFRTNGGGPLPKNPVDYDQIKADFEALCAKHGIEWEPGASVADTFHALMAALVAVDKAKGE